MSHSLLTLFIVFALIISLSHVQGFSSDVCQCEFDTPNYQAIGYFAGTCSYTMDATRKKCELRRAGDYYDIKKKLLNEKTFGNPFQQYSQFNQKLLRLHEEPRTILDFEPVQFFAFIMRSSYLAAPFIDDTQKEYIDRMLITITKEYGNDMLYAFAGLRDNNFFEVETASIYVKKGIAIFKVDINKSKFYICTKILPYFNE